MSIPLHLIGGPLGVGKTTAIRKFVGQTRDYVAVLVNDFGETGYDAALIDEAGGDNLRVENVPGGCLCCTSAAQLLPALKMLCANPEVDRVIVEPSGVALLDPILKMLREAAPVCGFELMPVIVLLDPAANRPAALKLIPYWKHLVDRADLIVANRCDLAPSQAIEQFIQCLENWTPPKRKLIQTAYGVLPSELFELHGRVESPGGEVHPHVDLPPAGTLRSDQLFRLDRLLDLLETAALETERFKGIFRTDKGWMRIEIAAGKVVQKPVQEVKGSSADWIGTHDFGLLLESAVL